ncbi:hypothetical protein G6F37_004799 [Rhizopus arrhizus]|nr:hypothetical protein G6F38_006160 [Rhizopus arrhizus]KAG1159539.1 hypothetical protein G6F37_004799 [Rhizopus arrhizus]
MREISKYYNEKWTVGEEINKSLIPKLKNYIVDTTQVVNSNYKGSEANRIHERAPTEIYEQFFTIQDEKLLAADAQQLFEEAMESAK